MLLEFNVFLFAEWRIGVTTSSSETQQVGQTFVQVKMIVETGSSTGSTGVPTQTVQVEMSVPKFYAFLSEMEKVKASLGLFK